MHCSKMRIAHSLPYAGGLRLSVSLKKPPPPPTETPSHVTCDACWDRDPRGQTKTPVKTLPCPKLRLRAVINNSIHSNVHSHSDVNKKMKTLFEFYSDICAECVRQLVIMGCYMPMYK